MKKQNSAQLAKVEKKKTDLPIEKLIQIQTLVDKGRSDAEIARLSDLPTDVVALIVENENWRESRLISDAERATHEEKRKAHLIRWERAVGAQARLLTLRGLNATGDKLDLGDVRNAKEAATVAKLMSDLARVSENMDTKSKSDSSPVGINLFFIERPLTREEKEAVSDVIEIGGGDPSPSGEPPPEIGVGEKMG